MEYDVYYYFGDINYIGYWNLTEEIEKQKKLRTLNKKVILCIATLGGDPDAGYRIGRALQHNYEDFSVLVFSFCKSAGTLLAIAANELIIADTGELGPLDIQIKKNDELDEANSGLDIMTALNSLQAVAANYFSQSMKMIHEEMRINAKLSGEMATKIIEPLISPITAQIDPIKFGEHQRVLNIATRYGQNLNQRFINLKPGALNKIIANYPSHGYVIDRKEARDLFFRVMSPNTQDIIALYEIFYKDLHKGRYTFHGKPQVGFYAQPLENSNENVATKKGITNGGSDERVINPDGADTKANSRANGSNKKTTRPNSSVSDKSE